MVCLALDSGPALAMARQQASSGAPLLMGRGSRGNGGVNDQPQVLGGLSGSQEETEGRVALGSRVTQRLPGLWGWAQDEFK